MRLLSADDFGCFAMISRSIWLARNQWVYEGHITHKEDIINRASEELAQFLLCQANPPGSLAPESTIVDFMKHSMLVHPMLSVMYCRRSANKAAHSF